MIIKGSLTLVKNLTVGGNLQTGNSGTVKLADADSSNFVALKAPSTVGADVTYTLPGSVGTSGYALTTDGTSGVLSWSAVSATPAGSGSELQYKNGSALGAVTNSAVSSSSISIGTTTTTGAQLTVLSSGTTLPPLKVQANSGAAGNIGLMQGYDGAGNLKINLQTDGSFSFPFLTYSQANRTLTLQTQTAPTTRGIVVGTTNNFAIYTQTNFVNNAQNFLGALNAVTTYTVGASIGHEDSGSGASTSLTGLKVFGLGSQASGTGSKDSVIGLDVLAGVVSTGGATTAIGGQFGVVNASTATITNVYGVAINSVGNAGIVTNVTGLVIYPQSGSSSSRAIYTQGGEVRIDTGGANNRGLLVHGAASQSANLLLIEDSSSNPLFTVNSSGYLSGQFLNSGLAIRDTNSSHKLSIIGGSDLTSDRSLTLTTGDASRILQLDGDVVLSGTNRVFRTQDNGSGIFLQGNVIGTTETTLLGGSGVISIPANWFTVGSMISICLRGDLTTATSGTNNFTFKAKLGTTVLATSGAVTFTNSITSATSFVLNIDINCWSTGATGGIDAVGEFRYNSGGTTPVVINLPNSLASINTANAQNLDVTVTLSNGVSGNSMNVYTVKVIGIKA